MWRTQRRSRQTSSVPNGMQDVGKTIHFLRRPNRLDVCRVRLWFGIAGAVLAMHAVAGAAPLPPERKLSIHLAPKVVGERVEAIEVTETFDVDALPKGAKLLSLPILTEAVPGVLRDPATLVASDARGPLPLERSDDPVDPAGVTQDHHWRTQRPTSGTITVTYLAHPRVVTAATKPGALKDMRSEGAGIHGSTKVLFAVPATGWPRQVHIEWDLSAMAPGSRAVTSFGEGRSVATLDAHTLSLGYFMAGPWQKLPANATDGFLVYYLTEPDFDLAAAARNAAISYRYATDFFGTELQPFRGLMRTTDRFQGGGTGGRDSFMFGTVRGAPQDPDALNYLLIHEALHSWIGALSKGPEGLWFVEGATNYYTAVLPFRAGQRTVAQVAAQIDGWTANYYANPRRTMGDDAAAAAFWSDTDAQILPYNRGALYIAQVDARLRAASAGRRRVDGLVRAMTQAVRRGDASEEVWLSLVTDALGERGKRDFEDMKAGRMLDLPADLFGPCFRRVSGPVGRYRPGFQIAANADGRYIVGPVGAGSAAATAGLVQGDEVLNWKAVGETAKRPGVPLTLKLKAGGGERELEFDPWVGLQDGFRWVEAIPRPKACML